MALAEAAAADRAPSASTLPIDVVPLSPPAALLGDGKHHLLYELRLTNFAAEEVALERVEVIERGTGKLLGGYEGPALTEILTRPGVEVSHPRRIGPGGFAVLYLHTRAPAQAAPPAALVHRLRFKSATGGTPADEALIVTEPLAVRREVAVLGPPLRGDGWLAANILSNTADHRRSLVVVDGRARIGQRYAIDFVRLDANGRAFVGDAGVNENWSGYGAEVLAVADGRVAAVTTGLPDYQKGVRQPPATMETIGGNSVALEIGGGRYVYYAHLKPGSLRVREGQRVRKGEVLGLLGNSGQSTAPHLHFHVADGVRPLASEGLPYAFESFELVGYLPSLNHLENGETWSPQRGVAPAPRRGELPLHKAVISFP